MEDNILKMAKTMSHDNILEAIIGVILVIYFVAYALPDAISTLQNINDSVTGAAILKILLPLFVALGIVYAVYRLIVKK